MKDSILFTKSKAFALRIVRLYKYLREHKESVIAKHRFQRYEDVVARVRLNEIGDFCYTTNRCLLDGREGE